MTDQTAFGLAAAIKRLLDFIAAENGWEGSRSPEMAREAAPLILAIEAEARAEGWEIGYGDGVMEAQSREAASIPDYRAKALHDAAEQVRALPKWDKRSVPGGFHVNRAAVLAILEPSDD